MTPIITGLYAVEEASTRDRGGTGHRCDRCCEPGCSSTLLRLHEILTHNAAQSIPSAVCFRLDRRAKENPAELGERAGLITPGGFVGGTTESPYNAVGFLCVMQLKCRHHFLDVHAVERPRSGTNTGAFRKIQNLELVSTNRIGQ
jgi:hypothetical protein